MTKLFYTLLIYFYKAGLNIAALFNKKARLKIDGIRASKLSLSNCSSSDNIFIHCASQGEHEQAKPIIRWILDNTKHQVILSFSSPSGFTHANLNDSERINKIYLPFDLPYQVRKLINSINPIVAIFVKNEWWWNLIYELKSQNIPTYLISATFRKKHYFVKYPLSFFKNGLNSFKVIFTIDEESHDIITHLLKTKIINVGDTRIDQVLYLKHLNLFHKTRPLNSDKKTDTIVYGSVWENDVPSITHLIKAFPKYNHLIYPHILDDNNLQKLIDLIPNAHLVKDTVNIKDGINVIAKMGELKHAYRLATLAYIGGGFSEGIHNVLEAAVYLIPTLFGPNYSKSNEAVFLVNNKLAFSFQNKQDLKIIYEMIGKEKIRKEIESKLKSYFSPEFSPSLNICEEIFSKNKLNV